jgi:hypothetical protein
MDRTSIERYIEPPPRLAASAEALPHLGGLALVPFNGELPDEIELHPVEALREAFDVAASSELLKRTLAHAKVRDRLSRCRHIVIGASRRGETDKGEARSFLVVAYDYNANVSVEISLDANGEVTGIADVQYQPALVEAEVTRAIEIARADSRIADHIGGMVGMAIPFEGANGEWAQRRVVEVLFGCRSERLPRLRAWVDLATETVLHAGDSCDCCAPRKEAQS